MSQQSRIPTTTQRTWPHRTRWSAGWLVLALGLAACSTSTERDDGDGDAGASLQQLELSQAAGRLLTTPPSLLSWQSFALPGKRHVVFEPVEVMARPALRVSADSSVSIFRRQFEPMLNQPGRISFSWRVDALPAGNPLEVFTIERLRAVVHMAAGNSAAAAKAIEKALQTERGTVADRVALMENLVLIQYRAKQYADAALWAGRYLALGGQREQLRQVQGQALYLSGQFQPAVDILQPRLMAEIAAGRVPDEVDIRLLASAHQQTKNTAAYVSTLEILVRFYPKPEVWADLLFRVLQRKDFPAYLEIDLRRLMQQVGAANTFADALDHAQLAISAGYPAEARKVLESVKATAKPESPEEGSKLNAQLANATRLQQEDDKQLPQLEAQLAQARDGNPWVNTGLNLALAGQAARGATLIAQGIEKGGLRQADAARYCAEQFAHCSQLMAYLCFALELDF